MTTDNFIHVSEEAWGEQRPRAVAIHLILTADKFFSGRAAFDKAVELRKLVMALGERDFPDTAVALTGATLDVSTGLFTKSSSVTYRVRVHVADVERLPEALDAIAESKQARVTHLDWDYGNSVTDDLLAECAKRAMAKARQLGAALGVTLAGVHSVHEEQIGDAPYPVPVAHAYGGMSRMAAYKHSVGEELAGLDLTPTKRIGVRVRLAYAMAS